MFAIMPQVAAELNPSFWIRYWKTCVLLDEEAAWAAVPGIKTASRINMEKNKLIVFFMRITSLRFFAEERSRPAAENKEKSAGEHHLKREVNALHSSQRRLL